MKRKLFIPLLILPISLFCSSMKSKRFASTKRTATNSTSVVNKSSKGDVTKRERYLTYNASLVLEISKKKWERSLEKIVKYTKKQGGYISSQTLSSINIKIPSAKFKEAFLYFKKLAAVESEDISVDDIGDVYIDTKVRLENSLKLQKRLKQLLDKAANVIQAIKVEKELSRVTERIEVLKAKMNLYQNQLDYSSIEIDFSKPERPGPLGWVFYGLYVGVKWLIIWD